MSLPRLQRRLRVLLLEPEEGDRLRPREPLGIEGIQARTLTSITSLFPRGKACLGIWPLRWATITDHEGERFIVVPLSLWRRSLSRWVSSSRAIFVTSLPSSLSLFVMITPTLPPAAAPRLPFLLLLVLFLVWLLRCGFQPVCPTRKSQPPGSVGSNRLPRR